MSTRLLALALAPGLLASTAYAQAPGEVAPGTQPGPPSAQPYAPSAQPYAPYAPYAQPSAPYAQPYAPYAPMTAPPVSPAMAHRFGIGLSLGGFVVTADGGYDGSEAEFRVGELALRYRASRRLELELAMSGGRQTLGDNTDGNLATGSVTVALRYRFMPEHRWNWFLLGGLGGTVIAPHDSTAEYREDMTRPLAMLGVGIERRFRRFAIQAELRTIAIGPREDAPMPLPHPPAEPWTPEELELDGAEPLGGSMFTLGASYYF